MSKTSPQARDDSPLTGFLYKTKLVNLSQTRYQQMSLRQTQDRQRSPLRIPQCKPALELILMTIKNRAIILARFLDHLLKGGHMKKMLLILSFLLTLGSSSIFYLYNYGLETENKMTELLVLDARPNPWSHKVDAVMFQFPDGKKILMNKMDFHESRITLDPTWEKLREGQILKFNHHLKYWKVFGKIIVKNHTDHLIAD